MIAEPEVKEIILPKGVTVLDPERRYWTFKRWNSRRVTHQAAPDLGDDYLIGWADEASAALWGYETYSRTLTHALRFVEKRGLHWLVIVDGNLCEVVRYHVSLLSEFLPKP